MDSKKYRICLVLFLVLVITGMLVYYFCSAKQEDAPMDGTLVKHYEVTGEIGDV